MLTLLQCQKSSTPPPEPPPPPPPAPGSISFNSLKVNGTYSGYNYQGVNSSPVIQFSFSGPVNKSSVNSAVTFQQNNGTAIPFNTTFQNGDSTIVIQPVSPLSALSKYSVSVSTALKSAAGGSLLSGVSVNLFTALDSSDKFPVISDDELLTLVQKQTFKYFWDFGHPTSGLARERNSSGDVVTTGGSGFGVMAMIVGVERAFITRAEGLQRLQLIVDFLKNKADKFHGAFPHWLNGVTGKTVAFSPNDNGADLVETSFLMQGLLTARQYFNGSSAEETQLRTEINELWQNVEWDWFRKGSENVLYWHWSPTVGWAMNMKIKGWNEALITYVLAASSPTHTIPKVVYDEGWASNGGMKNGNSYYGIQLPLGLPLGGPLFFEHYSFLGINPNGLTDQYADYEKQTKNHTLINYQYCKANPKNYYGYSDQSWGLTASDIPNGYTASSPTNDVGVIAPTAALSSFPYTPTESMKALKFFYYKLGDKLWGNYGFYDAYSLSVPWFASSYLAIDQGPIIVMIENYRSGLLWNLFMSCPEVKSGMTKLGFSSPHL
ncbi:MAG: glucoamylase family protein [Flavisolibacter sp.]